MCSAKYIFIGVLLSTLAQGQYFYPYCLVAYGTTGENRSEALGILREKRYILCPLAICKTINKCGLETKLYSLFINI